MKLTRPLYFLLLLILSIPATQADTLTVIREGSGMGGQSATTVRFWSGEDRLARIDDTGRMIVDLSAEKLYLINDQAGTCHAMSTRDSDRDPEALNAAVAAVEFRKTSKSQRIGKWQAEIHKLTTGSGDDAIDLVVWISDDIAVDTGQRAYVESVATPETAWMVAIYDLGFPVRQEVKIGLVQMWAELESMEEKPAPAGIYEIPDGCD